MKKQLRARKLLDMVEERQTKMGEQLGSLATACVPRKINILAKTTVSSFQNFPTHSRGGRERVPRLRGSTGPRKMQQSKGYHMGYVWALCGHWFISWEKSGGALFVGLFSQEV